ncbi:GNAT family N-acetyltransferase [Nocardia huaxiensis]|uniref:GNAT family N-acetyltransferase n=2 Tax=Nocardia huaxiensis TaxID=2755382 RepID=A0A7D6VKA5_9NOCA|nr:GNAT family N-acetyltransferase [Nocardia huaxiensis]
MDAIVNVIAGAFATEDPIEEYVFPSEAIRHRKSPRMLRIMIEHRFLPSGGAAVATLDDKIVGAALWYPAGYRKSLWHEAISGPKLLWAMGLPATRKGIAVDAAIAEVSPREPHHLLVYLGTDPSLQRVAGVGRALFQWLTALGDEQQVGVGGICKDANVPYYAALGTELIRKIRIGRDGPEMNFVLRQPVATGR